VTQTRGFMDLDDHDGGHWPWALAAALAAWGGVLVVVGVIAMLLRP
jgi:hypothetical protein